jgi:hypothetical protein
MKYAKPFDDKAFAKKYKDTMTYIKRNKKLENEEIRRKYNDRTKNETTRC